MGIMRQQPASSIFSHVAAFGMYILRGLGQLMLQENAATGLLFLVGIFVGSVPMGLAALLATACGTITALLLNSAKPDIGRRLYGFSSALVGVAIMLFFKRVMLLWMLVIFLS